MRIGVISDTHDLLRAEVKAFLQGADRIFHAGDICSLRILDELRAIAPVTAVRGNNDRGPWAAQLKEEETVTLDGTTFYLIHDLKTMLIDPLASGINIIIHGHSHQPRQIEKNGVLYLNPGSAGPRRFKLPIAVAEILLHNGSALARHQVLS